MLKRIPATSQLHSICASAATPEEAAEFAVDGLAPTLITRPATYEEVAAVLRYANVNSLAVIPRAGTSMMDIGNTARRYDVALDLSRLAAVIEHEPADLMVTCQTGITVAALQGRLAEQGQTVPLGPFSVAATVGGVLATNARGAWCHAYGSARDWTIGMRVVTADGRLTRAGGRVVKNVAGYDLCKLYIGSYGTIGVIVEATFKLLPLPKASVRLALDLCAPARACGIAADAGRLGLSLRGIELLLDGAHNIGECAAIFDLAGSEAGVRRSEQELAALGRQRGLEFRRGGVGGLPVATKGEAPPLSCRISVLPGRVAPAMGALHRLGAASSIVAWPSVGAIFCHWTDAGDASTWLAAVRGVASQFNGWMLVERCPLALKNEIDVFGEAPPALPLMRRIKQEFDPQGTLNPGRFLGGL